MFVHLTRDSALARLAPLAAYAELDHACDRRQAFESRPATFSVRSLDMKISSSSADKIVHNVRDRWVTGRRNVIQSILGLADRLADSFHVSAGGGGTPSRAGSPRLPPNELSSLRHARAHTGLMEALTLIHSRTRRLLRWNG